MGKRGKSSSKTEWQETKNTPSKDKRGREVQREKGDLYCRNRDRCSLVMSEWRKEYFPEQDRGVGLTELLQLHIAILKLSCRQYEYVLCHMPTQQCSGWGGRGESLHTQCHGDGCQGAAGSTVGNEAGIWPGLGKEKSSLQMDKGADSNVGDHWLKPPYLDRSETVETVPPLAPNLQPFFLSSIISSPMSHSTPARGSPPDKFIISLPPPLQRCWLIRWFVTYCLPSLLAVWEADGEQEQTTHSNGTLNPLVITQRKLHSKFTAYGGFYLNSMLMSWHITNISRHNFFFFLQGEGQYLSLEQFIRMEEYRLAFKHTRSISVGQ